MCAKGVGIALAVSRAEAWPSALPRRPTAAPPKRPPRPKKPADADEEQATKMSKIHPELSREAENGKKEADATSATSVPADLLAAIDEDARASFASRKRIRCETSAPAAADVTDHTLEGDQCKSGLVIKRKWLDLILSGQKTWEIRGSRTTKRERIALIESGSGHVVGEAKIADCLLSSLSELQQHGDKHRIEDVSIIKYRKSYAWVLTEVKRHMVPMPYEHPQGAVTWINLAKAGA